MYFLPGKNRLDGSGCFHLCVPALERERAMIKCWDSEKRQKQHGVGME